MPIMHSFKMDLTDGLIDFSNGVFYGGASCCHAQNASAIGDDLLLHLFCSCMKNNHIFYFAGLIKAFDLFAFS